jgi:hypothetical protein
MFTVGVNVVDEPLQSEVEVGSDTVGTGLTVIVPLAGTLGHPLSV